MTKPPRISLAEVARQTGAMLRRGDSAHFVDGQAPTLADLSVGSKLPLRAALQSSIAAPGLAAPASASRSDEAPTCAIRRIATTLKSASLSGSRTSLDKLDILFWRACFPSNTARVFRA